MRFKNCVSLSQLSTKFCCPKTHTLSLSFSLSLTHTHTHTHTHQDCHFQNVKKALTTRYSDRTKILTLCRSIFYEVGGAGKNVRNPCSCNLALNFFLVHWVLWVLCKESLQIISLVYWLFLGQYRTQGVYLGGMSTPSFSWWLIKFHNYIDFFVKKGFKMLAFLGSNNPL